MSHAPVGSSASRSSSASSMAMRAVTTTLPSAWRSTVGSSTSYSSTISPTSSSITSSRVTSPAVPPYSSTTIEEVVLAVLHLGEQGGDALGLGDEVGRADVVADRVVPEALVLHRHQVLQVDDAHHVVDVVVVHGQPAVAGLQRHFER